MKTLKNFVFITLLFCSLNLLGQNAKEILKKTDDVTYAAKDQQLDIKIILIDKAGKESIREAKTMQKGSSMRLFRFTSPASQAGIAMLSLPNDVMYLYLPAFGKERRIASHVKNQKFAGTDFSYDNMESKPFSDKYDAISVKTEGDFYIVEMTPKAGQASDYSKLIANIYKSNYYLKKVDFYDKKGEKMKTLDNEKVEKIGNYWTATDFTMTDIKANHKTRMIFSNIKYDSNLSDDEFSVRKLLQ